MHVEARACSTPSKRMSSVNLEALPLLSTALTGALASDATKTQERADNFKTQKKKL
jgi:hypothetical protein